MKAKDWKPQTLGPLYCSPACGGGCKRVDYDAATKAGGELAKQLGAGWTPVVWENLGWFYKVMSPCANIQVYPLPARTSGHFEPIGYAVKIEGQNGGQQWLGEGATPTAAVSASLAKLQASHDLIRNLLVELTSEKKPPKPRSKPRSKPGRKR